MYKSILLIFLIGTSAFAQDTFEGKHYRGRGDVEYLKLLDISRRMFEPDPEFQNISMLYEPKWNGLVEGPTWDAWWVQNSYGTTFAALPFLQEPFVTFLQNSQDLWFDQMGDGKRKGAKDWVAPDGCLCDAARPGWIYYRQGDGRIDIHDWGMEFTAAGVVMQAELLLISRDIDAIKKYLPKLERSVNFIETRRDEKTGLFLAGPAGNLLAPSFSGYKKPDGTYDKAYHAGLQVTYIAALDRVIELKKLSSGGALPDVYIKRRDAARASLPKLVTDEGYFINSIDPDGTKHGVFGAPKHGYFESSVNHDAIAFHIADDAQAEKIYNKIKSIPQLRPHAFIIPNYPGYDDMYEKPEGLWAFGYWVNGGHWSTCEARMMLAYARLGKFDDIKASMNQLMKFAKQFRMDNPLVDFGNAVYQPNQPINITYDAFGPPAAMIRGLFEYIYSADGLTLIPHIPPNVTLLEQYDHIRFGKKRIHLSVSGAGPITAVEVNGKPWKEHSATTITIPYTDDDQWHLQINIALGGAPLEHPPLRSTGRGPPKDVPSSLAARVQRVWNFQFDIPGGLRHETQFAELIINAAEAAGKDKPLPKTLPPDSAAAGQKLYESTTVKLLDGFDALMKSYAKSSDPVKQHLSETWTKSDGK